MSEFFTNNADRKLRYDGPNLTADAVIIDPEAARILLIERADTGEWALPGGFIDPADASSCQAASREAKEEAGVDLGTDAPLIYRGVVDDPRNTDTSWIETSAHLFTLPSTTTVQASDDARQAAWHELADLPELYASHRHILERGIDYIEGERLFAAVDSPDAVHPVEGGYMQYDKWIAEKDGERTFVKRSPRHHPRFDELQRYLEKEAAIMAHLRQYGYAHSPERSALRDNELVMDALRPEDGWQWEADQTTIDAYLLDTIAAFKELEAVPLPPDTFGIEPSYDSILDEGWRAFDASVYERLAEKSGCYLPRLSPESQESALRLLRTIPELHDLAVSAPSPDRFVLCHHDIRQSNFAWHPQKGTKIIDWSWTGPGLPGTDSTGLLIDLHKNGYDVSMYRAYINPQHGLNLMGFWLQRASLPEHRADGLRYQQFTAALSAYELLETQP